jgi:hypothetical protein
LRKNLRGGLALEDAVVAELADSAPGDETDLALDSLLFDVQATLDRAAA